MILITGTYPPERCGVGDYAQHLMSTTIGREWTLFYRSSWRLADLWPYLKQLHAIEDNCINLQYPTMGYSTSLVPHLLVMCAVLFLRKRLYLTIHEYSQLGKKGRMALNMLFLFAKDIIFTTSFELECARKQNLNMHKGQVIKIRSNIPATDSKPMAQRKWDVGYFGYIRPLKGLETFTAVAEKLQAEGRRVYLMGQVQPEYASFHQPLLHELEQKGIAYLGGKSQAEVADILADTKLMYLPYPDGLSERRGSFLAAVVNGAAVVSQEGVFTSQQQKILFPLVASDLAAEQINQWLDDPQWLDHQQQNSLMYAQESVPASWEQIAEQYARLIQ